MPSPRRVAITAVGIVSPLGLGAGETLEGLKAARDCVEPVRLFDVSRCRSRTAGQVDDVRLTARLPFTKKELRRVHRAGRMMMAAACEVIASDFGFRPEALVVGTTSGGMSFGEAFYRAVSGQEANGRCSKALWTANYPPLKPAMDAQNALGICVPVEIVANACASGSNAIGHAFSLIRSGQRTKVLAGGYDAISELVFVGFDSLQASTPGECRPFDKGRDGLAMGEGAALLALEEWGSAQKRGAPILGEITGYGCSTDNHHLTQPNPSGIGPLSAMERALQSAGLKPAQIDYINAHGTGTPFNDASEGAAIAQLFGSGTPVSSTKSQMGHALGAAGALEAVCALLALRTDFLPANIHFREPDPQLALDIVANSPRPALIRRVLSNSFGFGGANASLILEGCAP